MPSKKIFTNCVKSLENWKNKDSASRGPYKNVVLASNAVKSGLISKSEYPCISSDETKDFSWNIWKDSCVVHHNKAKRSSNPDEYFLGLQLLGSIKSLEDFEEFWSLIPLSKYKAPFNLSVSASNSKPVWEHPTNRNGGHFILRQFLSKEHAVSAFIECIRLLYNDPKLPIALQDLTSVVLCIRAHDTSHKVEFWVKSKDSNSIINYEEYIKNLSLHGQCSKRLDIDFISHDKCLNRNQQKQKHRPMYTKKDASSIKSLQKQNNKSNVECANPSYKSVILNGVEKNNNQYIMEYTNHNISDYTLCCSTTTSISHTSNTSNSIGPSSSRSSTSIRSHSISSSYSGSNNQAINLNNTNCNTTMNDMHHTSLHVSKEETTLDIYHHQSSTINRHNTNLPVLQYDNSLVFPTPAEAAKCIVKTNILEKPMYINTRENKKKQQIKKYNPKPLVKRKTKTYNTANYNNNTTQYTTQYMDTDFYDVLLNYIISFNVLCIPDYFSMQIAAYGDFVSNNNKNEDHFKKASFIQNAIIPSNVFVDNESNNMNPNDVCNHDINGGNGKMGKYDNLLYNNEFYNQNLDILEYSVLKYDPSCEIFLNLMHQLCNESESSYT